MNWGHLDWLSSVVETKVPRTIYSVHYYEPYPYSSSTQAEFKDYRYPGRMKTDESHKDKEFVDKGWLDKEFLALDEFRRAHPDLPVALTEFGPIRWKKNCEIYYGDVVSLFEKRGLNYAVWIWEPGAKPPEHNNWNFQFGPEEKSKAAVETSPLIEAIKKSWSRNAR
jgi:hypothetical protein